MHDIDYTSDVYSDTDMTDGTMRGCAQSMDVSHRYAAWCVYMKHPTCLLLLLIRHAFLCCLNAIQPLLAVGIHRSVEGLHGTNDPRFPVRVSVVDTYNRVNYHVLYHEHVDHEWL